MKLVITLVLLCALVGCSDSTADAEPMTAAERRTELISEAFSQWDGAHYNLQRHIKSNLKDPDSYEHVETRYGDQGDHIVLYTKYRAKNSFGGYVFGEVTAKAKIDGTLIEITGSR